MHGLRQWPRQQRTPPFVSNMDLSKPCPKLSVIVVSFNDSALLEQCLRSLQSQSVKAEILVVRDWQTHVQAETALKQTFDNVIWVSPPLAMTIPKMRSLGIETSRGEIVALLEDDCIVSPDWVSNLLLAHQSTAIAIGGAINPGEYTKSLDWSVYFCEYGRFMQPFSGEVTILPGNHVSYKRSGLQAVVSANSNASGFYEVFIHDQLQLQGHALRAESSLSVKNINAWQLENVVQVPFLHGRGFASMRLQTWPSWKRYCFLGLAWGLPFLLLYRALKQPLSRRRYIFQMIWALPGMALFYLSWTAGEVVGCLIGPGKSLEAWR